MKKLFFIIALFACLALEPAKISEERFQANKDYFARKKKPKKTIVKMGSKKQKKEISEDEPLILLDEAQAVVTTIMPEKAQIETSIVTLQDVTRQGFDGGKYTTEDLIDFSLMDHLSKAFKINVTNDDINRYCQKMNLSTEHLKYISENNWFPSLDAFYDLFKKNYRGRMALNFLVESQIVVTEDEIKDYWKKNPVWLEPAYFVETSFIPFKGKSLEELQSDIADKEKRNKLTDLDWDPIVKVVESEVGSNNNFLFDLAVNDVYLKPEDNGITLYRLQSKLPKREKPLAERKTEISGQLKMEKAMKVEEKEKAGLRKDALIYKPTFETPATTKELVAAAAA